MEMKKCIQDIYKVLSTDENLLRLLYYSNPVNALDSPLDPTKSNILNMEDKWDIIFDLIQTSPKVSDLDSVNKCRLLIYPGRRSSTGSYLIGSQEFVFDILVNMEADLIDQRLSWVCDTVNELLFNERIAGFGKMMFKSGGNINCPSEYVAYRLIYEFGDFQK